MNFLETLQAVGGVKPCLHGCPTPEMAMVIDTDFDHNLCGCPKCHGTGQILDLAPLMARPLELEVVSKSLIIEWSRVSGQTWRNIYVVGPQRAGNLIYEITSQLGGTAVVVVEKERNVETGIGVYAEHYNEFSVPIPETATVLFVTDRYSAEEMLAIEQTVGKCNMLPYVLALVSAQDIHKNEACKVICLHKEVYNLECLQTTGQERTEG